MFVEMFHPTLQNLPYLLEYEKSPRVILSFCFTRQNQLSVNESTYQWWLWSTLWTKSKFLHYSDPFLLTDDFFSSIQNNFCSFVEKCREYSPDIFFPYFWRCLSLSIIPLLGLAWTDSEINMVKNSAKFIISFIFSYSILRP